MCTCLEMMSFCENLVFVLYISILHLKVPLISFSSSADFENIWLKKNPLISGFWVKYQFEAIDAYIGFSSFFTIFFYSFCILVKSMFVSPPAHPSPFCPFETHQYWDTVLYTITIQDYLYLYCFGWTISLIWLKQLGFYWTLAFFWGSFVTMTLFEQESS